MTPEDLKYTAEHEWARAQNAAGGGTVIRVGITDYAQEQLGDVVYLELPKVADRVEQMKVFGVIESVKTASDLYAPVSGEVVEVNRRVIDEPSTVNDAPYEAGWLIKVRPDSTEALERELAGLTEAAAYEQQVGG